MYLFSLVSIDIYTELRKCSILKLKVSRIVDVVVAEAAEMAGEVKW